MLRTDGVELLRIDGVELLRTDGVELLRIDGLLLDERVGVDTEPDVCRLLPDGEPEKLRWGAELRSTRCIERLSALALRSTRVGTELRSMRTAGSLLRVLTCGVTLSRESLGWRLPPKPPRLSLERLRPLLKLWLRPPSLEWRVLLPSDMRPPR